MNIAEPLIVLKSEWLQKLVPDLLDLLASAQQVGTPQLPQVEDDDRVPPCPMSQLGKR